MTLDALGLLAVFGAGILSILAPCVVTLLPSYLSYLAGTSLDEAANQSSTRWRVALHALWFVLGCTLLFVGLGAVAGALGGALSAYQQALDRIAGVLLIVFGVALIGVLPIPWLSWDHRVSIKPGRAVWWRSGLLGIAFAAGWSVCTGPILGSILALTAARAAVAQGMLIMLVFALGQGVPLLLIGLLVDRISPFLRRVRRYTAIVSYVGGAVLILLGVFMVSGLFSTSG